MKIYTIFAGNIHALHNYKTIEAAKLKLYELIQSENKNEQPYFVDNDFFENLEINKYSSKLKYYCIKESEISEWKKY